LSLELLIGGRGNLKDQDTREKYGFDREKRVDFSKQQLKSAEYQQLCASVPADIREGLEIISDSRYAPAKAK
jgi:hypothetical protein